MFLWMKVRKEPLCLDRREFLEKAFSSDFFHKSDEDLKMIVFLLLILCLVKLRLITKGLKKSQL